MIKSRIAVSIAPLSVGLALISRWFEDPILDLLSGLVGKRPSTAWPEVLIFTGWVFALTGVGILLAPGLWSILKAVDNRLPRLLEKWVRPAESPPALMGRWPALGRTDWILIVFFLAVALVLFVGAIQGNFPYIMIDGDAANIASFAAGLDHTDWFRGDPLLSDPRNYSIYSTFNIFFIRLLYPLTGSYSLAFLILVPIQVFLQLLGFYFLGRVLWGSRFWAFLFTLFLSMNIPLNLGEFWGIADTPISRVNFQALLPYVLTLALIWRNRPRRWPWVMIAGGILVYLHPVSAPAWLAAVWLGLWLFIPAGWSWPRRLGVMVVVGLCSVASILPFILTYLQSHVSGKSPHYDLVMTVFFNTFPANLLHIPAAVESFLEITLREGLLPLGLLSLALLWILLHKRRQLLLVVLAWLSGILLVSVLLPLTLREVERVLVRVPFETELVRGIRYVVPLLLMLIFWCFYELSGRLRFSHANRWMSALAAVLVAVGIAFHPPEPATFAKGITCLAQGRPVCYPPTSRDQLLDAVRALVPVAAPVYVTFSNQSLESYGLPIRYLALRPLVYAFKDRAMLVYSNTDQLVQWSEIYERVREIDHKANEPQRMMERHLILARELNARYLVASFKADLSDPQLRGLKQIYENPDYSLFEITPSTQR